MRVFILSPLLALSAGLTRTLEYAWPSLLQAVLRPANADLFAYLQFDSSAASTQRLHAFFNVSVCPAAVHVVVEAAAPAPGSLKAKVTEQGRKISRCFALIEEKLLLSRQRSPYSLVLSTRADVVYPPRPFPFAHMLDLTAVHLPVVPRLGFIFIPLCCDNKAVMDMMAVGSYDAMKLYMRWGATSRGEHATGEQSVAMQLEAPTKDGRILLHRFWYEFALLRSNALAKLEALGPRVFTEYFHSAAVRAFIVSNATKDSVVNASTECTFDPKVDITPEMEYEMTGRESRIQSKRSKFIGYPSGTRQWRLETMKCEYRPRTSGFRSIASRAHLHATKRVVVPYGERQQLE